MATRTTVPDPALRDLAGWLLTWPWPLPETVLHELTAARGWRPQPHEPGQDLRWRVPGLPGDEPQAEATVADGVVAAVRIGTAPELVTWTPEGAASLRTVFTEQVGVLTALWGPPEVRTPGARPSARWFLPSGASLEVRGGLSCTWGLRAPEPAEPVDPAG